MTHKVNWRTSLQPLLDYISRNTATLLLYGILFGAILLFYSQVVGGYVTLFLVILLGAYAFSMTISFKAMKKLEKYEKDGCLTFPRIARLSFRIACPIYWCWFLFSFVPIMSVDAWYITGFPITMVSAFPLKSLSDYWDNWIHIRRYDILIANDAHGLRNLHFRRSIHFSNYIKIRISESFYYFKIGICLTVFRCAPYRYRI